MTLVFYYSKLAHSIGFQVKKKENLKKAGISFRFPMETKKRLDIVLLVFNVGPLLVHYQFFII